MRDAFAQNYEVVDALSSANIVVHPNGNDFNKSRAPTLVSSELLKYAVKGKGFQDLSGLYPFFVGFTLFSALISGATLPSGRFVFSFHEVDRKLKGISIRKKSWEVLERSGAREYLKVKNDEIYPAFPIVVYRCQLRSSSVWWQSWIMSVHAPRFGAENGFWGVWTKRGVGHGLPYGLPYGLPVVRFLKT